VGEFAQQNKAQNYPKHGAVNLTGIWRESLGPYPGRSGKRWTEGEAQPEGAIACSDTKLVYQKSAEAIVLLRTGERLNIKRLRSISGNGLIVRKAENPGWGA
jgi:hypothetical protein